METEDAEGARAEAERGLRPGQAPCCVPNQETTQAGRMRRRNGEGWRRGGGRARRRGPSVGGHVSRLSRAVPLTPSPRWNA